MVHQLSLVSSIPHSQYLQTISSFKVLTGLLQPQPISTYSILTKPNHIFKPKFEPGKINQIEQYYMKCNTTWSDTDIDLNNPIIKEDNIIVSKLFTNDGENERVWTLNISDIPIAGKNQQVCQQQIYESTLIHTSDSFLTFLLDLGYEVKNQYWLKGIRFFYGDIIIEIYKVFIRDDQDGEGIDGIKLKLLDESNQFQIKCYINIKNSTEIESINSGIKELVKLQEYLKNLFILEIPDRMYMDSRLKQ
ncbi:unnamed protein product [Candida verbasci]|uniref:Mediator of RNA polymerase II transcription subunit 18 n=1 Tax=Candida verbasci TaxID=1227364 RepID=A0A9W4TY25_9ASCO|nr:unnamed protein product [Candida verbasci]